jgi:hypothetical protein
MLNPDGTVAMSGTGQPDSATGFCAACHSVAKVNDYVFGNGTIMQVKPTPMGGPATNPCAVRNPCAAKNPCGDGKR